VAVIGARPATGPWFLGGLGGRVRPRPRRRPQPRHARGAAGSRVDRRVRQRLDVRALLVGIAAAAGLALFYLSQSSQVAATGYEIDGLHALLAERRAEQQQLILQIGNARSPAEIARRAQVELQLVPLAEGAVRFAPAPTTIAD
jgi:hypothetical protein